MPFDKPEGPLAARAVWSRTPPGVCRTGFRQGEQTPPLVRQLLAAVRAERE